MKPSKGDSKNRWVLSVKMWGVFTKRGKVCYVRPCKDDADELASDMKLGDIVRPVTVSWEEKKRQS